MMLALGLFLYGTESIRQGFWGYTFGPYLALAALVVFLTTLTAYERLWYSEGDKRQANANLAEYMFRYGKLTRWSRRFYSGLAAMAGILSVINLAFIINGIQAIDTTLLAVTLFLPQWISYRFSEQLIAAEVSEGDYIKGTTTSREVAIYWIVIVIATIYSTATPGLHYSNSIIQTLAQALSVVALARICSTGYKDYKEALSGVIAPATDEKAVPYKLQEHSGGVACSVSRNPEVQATTVPSMLRGLQVTKPITLTRKELKFIRAVSARGMTSGGATRRYPYNREPYGRARIPTALGPVTVDGKVLRVENGPLVEFWRDCGPLGVLHVFIPGAWVLSIRRDKSSWQHPYDVLGDA